MNTLKFLKSLFYKDSIRVLHGGNTEKIGGPGVKLWRMNQFFPNYNKRYNIIYSVSGNIDLETCLNAKARGVKIVCHMNSCGHPAYAEKTNKYKRFSSRIHNELADFIVYGSKHAKRGAELYVGKSQAPYKFIYNAVDLDHFKPSLRNTNNGRYNILVMGFHYIRHRIEPVLGAMPIILEKQPNAKLIIAGEMKKGEGVWDCSKDSFKELIARIPKEAIEFIPAYTQREAPEIYAMGDVLVHLKHMDWTPNTVIEAMACGLPIVHMGNGGLNELVGKAGISLNIPEDWDKILEPTYESVANGVIQAMNSRESLSSCSREIALKNFDMGNWADEHSKIFESLLNR